MNRMTGLLGAALLSTVTACTQPKEKTIAATVMANDNFSTLEAALKAADLTATLEGTGPFTVFAPTNAAFEKLPAGTLTDLLKPENKEKLKNILLYHVVPGKVPASQVLTLNGKTVDTALTGKKISVAVSGTDVTLNGNSKVTQTDLMASNGIIHVIDTVLTPPAN